MLWNLRGQAHGRGRDACVPELHMCRWKCSARAFLIYMKTTEESQVPPITPLLCRYHWLSIYSVLGTNPSVLTCCGWVLGRKAQLAGAEIR